MADFDYENKKGRGEEFEPAPWWVERILERMTELEKRIDVNERSIRRTALIKSGIRKCLKSANDNKAFWFIGAMLLANALGIDIDWQLVINALGLGV